MFTVTREQAGGRVPDGDADPDQNAYRDVPERRFASPLLVWKLPPGAAARVRAKEIHPLPASQTTLDAIRYGLYLVTQSVGGTSYNAWLGTSLDVAGKSGTAEDLSQGSDHVFFAAYANRSDPNIVALGALEEGQSGSAEVAPMLRHIMERRGG